MYLTYDEYKSMAALSPKRILPCWSLSAENALTGSQIAESRT